MNIVIDIIDQLLLAHRLPSLLVKEIASGADADGSGEATHCSWRCFVASV
jgi:hypothetical protein